MNLDGDIKLPVGGKVPKKAAAGGVAVVGLLVGAYYLRKRKATAAGPQAVSPTASDQYPPDGTQGNPQDPYSTDPATGQTYGDEATGSGGALGAFGTGNAVSSGTYPWDGTTGNQSDPYSLNPQTGETYGNQGAGPVTNPNGGPPFPNNSAWENWAVQQLANNDPGLDQGALTTALGEYLNGQPVTAAQKTLIFDATGTAGNPPIAGPNNYPPNVRTNGHPGGGGATVPVPNVVGQSQEAAFAILAAASLKAKGSPVVKGKVLTVDKQNPAAGRKVAEGTTVTLTSAVKPAAGTRARIPNVVGMEQAKAFQALSAAGFKPSGPAPVKGKVHTVTAEHPAAGTEAAKGSRVTVTSRTS